MIFNQVGLEEKHPKYHTKWITGRLYNNWMIFNQVGLEKHLKYHTNELQVDLQQLDDF